MRQCTLTIEEDLSVAAIPEEKQQAKKRKIYRVTVKASGYSCSDSQLHKTIFESIYTVSKDRQESKGVVVNEE